MSHDSRHAPTEGSVSNQIRSRPIYLLDLRATSLSTRRSLSFLVNALMFIEDKAYVRTREKS